MPRDWSNHRYIDKYRSNKTGKWVYVYADEGRRIGDAVPIVRSHSRKGMTKKQRAADDRRHRSYNKKRAVVNAGRTVSNLGKAFKALVRGKKAGKYIARSKRGALKTLRNITNLATSYSGHTGKNTKTKQWIEKQLYKNGRPNTRSRWQ